MTLDELEHLKNIESLENNCLIDVQKINIDTDMPAYERMLNYLELVKNPYCFMCGKTPVKVCFLSNGIKLSEKLKSYFLSLKREI